MRTLASLLAAALLLPALTAAAATFTTNAPSTTDNDDTCDIAVMPAATLLVPYFEVDVKAPGSQTTILTVTNASHLPQATRITLWTDYGYPVIDFPMYLTGYDVQSINLFDVIARGRIAPDRGTGSDVSPVGELSGTSPDDAFDNPGLDEGSCTQLPVQVPVVYITRMQSALTLGKVPSIGSFPSCEHAGGVHANAVGYATIDVVGACTSSLPTDAAYFASEIRYDNVLMGDYLQVNGTENSAQGSPMVHIRAMPEGGTVATRKPTNLPRTFYSRLLPPGGSDGRQPLPSTFAARWIAGGPTAFETFYKIWREMPSGATLTCSAYANNPQTKITEVVRFDEDENPRTIAPPVNIPELIPTELVLPATALVSVSGELFPPGDGIEVAGWVYMNLHDQREGQVASQNWVVTSMRAEGRFSVDLDALALGNGCTRPTPVTNAYRQGGQPIGPASNTTP